MYRVSVRRREGKVARKGLSPISRLYFLRVLTFESIRSNHNLKVAGLSPSSGRLIESWIIVEGYAGTAYKGHAGGVYWLTGEAHFGADSWCSGHSTNGKGRPFL